MWPITGRATSACASSQAGPGALRGASEARWQAGAHLGSFATAEEAALCVARSPEGRKAAAAARVPPLVSEEGDAGEEVKEENIEVLDAIEVDVWTDDGDDEVQDLLGSGRERDE